MEAIAFLCSQHKDNSVAYRPVLSASTTDLNEIHYEADDKENVPSNIFFPSTADVSLPPAVSLSGCSKS